MTSQIQQPIPTDLMQEPATELEQEQDSAQNNGADQKEEEPAELQKSDYIQAQKILLKKFYELRNKIEEEQEKECEGKEFRPTDEEQK